MNEKDLNKIKIAKCLATLPNNIFLRLKLTNYQLLCFLAFRVQQGLVASALIAKYMNQNNFLELLFKNKQLDRTTYNLTWHFKEWVETLWELVEFSEPSVKVEIEKMGIEYPFKSAFHLFENIVCDYVNGSFALCLKPYHEVSKDKKQKALRLAAKEFRGEKLDSDQEKIVTKAFGQDEKNTRLLDFVLAVCRSKVSARRTPLKSKLEDFNAATVRLFEVQATARRKGGSIAWKDGVLGFGSKTGTYDFLNKT